VTVPTRSPPPFDAAQLRRVLHPLDTPPCVPADRFDGDAAATSAAAVLVPLVHRSEGMTLLLTRRTDTLRTHAGQVSFPGGRVERADADAVGAALRETYEETGIAPRFVDPLGYLDSFDTVSGFCVSPVVGWVEPGFELAPDPAEVSAVFEVPLDYVLAPGRLHATEIQWRGERRRIHEFHYEGHRVWGATAAIILNLIRRLEASS
jgi:8-oxo-dGTP pyrophosphatase MutT (NUDIX family)